MKILKTGCIVLVLLTLCACVSQGKRELIKVTMPDGEEATIVSHNQSVPDWMLNKNKLVLNYLVKGDVSKGQLAAAAEAERACRIYTKTVRPSNLVAVFSSGVLYATAGWIGAGLGAKAFTGADSHQYAEYGAYASGLGGTANGLITLGGQTYTFENCAREILYSFPGYGVRVIMKSPY